ncbi:glycosyltransferase [Alkalihalobacillus sp. MEB130]|uniref:glycosyltransferase family 2 protein n=1 Tax=Alkalihalobacillus sp. MEB130 TaxID=2976704 RepID=UPI0028DEC5CA|nr:glycosyltransferase [Alkalihalobacillus sp. MEB130]MDT8861098.1 glycosyltransferase [Alkalihalobacillus sp. MEB130]
MLPKVSVVVPIYKVENYLSRCVDSILNQTYLNLEVILVNDGSPDRCGKMIEEFAAKDTRVKAVHKQNGGLSDARNYGMKYVTGEYTLFVDSDDWADLSMIEEMVETSLSFQADVVQSAFYYAYEDHLLFDNRYYSQDDPPVILNNKEVMSELVINERVKNFAWGKLYKTNLIKDIPFKKGVLFEDVFWAHKVMHQVNKYVILNRPQFYYLQRSDSIVATYTPRNLDIIKGLKERHSFIERHYEGLVDDSYKVIVRTCLTHFNLLLLNGLKDKGGIHKQEIKNYIQAHAAQFNKAVKKDKELKKQLALFLIHPYLNVGFLAAKKLLRKIKLLPRPIGLERINT